MHTCVGCEIPSTETIDLRGEPVCFACLEFLVDWMKLSDWIAQRSAGKASAYQFRAKAGLIDGPLE